MGTNQAPTIARPKYLYFVSSTYGDLAEIRQRVMLAILKAQHIPTGMEEFAAMDDRGWRIIQKTIDICDYYIVIVAGRYGTIDTGTEDKISWTHKEYRYAKERGIPVLAFIRDDQHIKLSEAEQDAAKNKKLKAFKDELKKTHHVIWWTDIDNLLYNVSDTIPKAIDYSIEEDKPRPGWYRGDSLLMSKTAVDEFANISAENRKQRDTIEKLQAQIVALTEKSNLSTQAMETEIRNTYESLRRAARAQDVVQIGNGPEGAMPPGAAEALNVLSGVKLVEWRVLRTDVAKVAVERIDRFQIAAQNFIENARNFGTKLRDAVRRYNFSKGTEASNDRADLSFFMGKVFGVKDEDVMPHVQVPAGALPRLTESFKAIVADHEIEAAVAPYQKSRNELKVALNEFSKLLDG